MMGRIAVLVFFLAISSCLFGCSQNPQENDPEFSGYYNEDDEVDLVGEEDDYASPVSQYGQESMILYGLEEIEGAPLCVKDGDSFYLVDGNNQSYTDNDWYPYDASETYRTLALSRSYGPEMFDAVSNTVDVTNGQVLVTGSSRNPRVTLYPVISQEYFGESKGWDAYSDDLELNGTALALDGLSHEERRAIIDDALTSAEIRYLDPEPGHPAVANRNGLLSLSPTTLKYGHFDGTHWEEGVNRIDIPCIVFDYGTSHSSSNTREFDYEPIILEAEKTKNGYFSFDCSMTPKGKYVIAYASGSAIVYSLLSVA